MILEVFMNLRKIDEITCKDKYKHADNDIVTVVKRARWTAHFIEGSIGRAYVVNGDRSS